jgi:hypothetical protein
MINFSAPVQSTTGEQFRLIIRPEAQCYCYIVAESSNGDVVVVYSGNLLDGEIWYSPTMMLESPRGSEALLIIVSGHEQGALNQRITAYNRSPNSTQRRALLSEVFRVRSESSRHMEVPEKPVLMGGVARGAEDKNIGVEYSGLDTYFKVVTIEH